MLRTALALALVAGSGVALAPTAPAAPVAANRLAGVEVELLDRDGSSRRIDLRVTSALRLSLQVSECEAGDCRGFDHYQTRLDPAAVWIHPEEARGWLRAVVGGRPLAVEWEPASREAVLIGGTEGSGSDDGQAFSSYAADPALVTVTWGSATCEADGLVGDELRVESPEGSAGAARPLSGFRASGVLGC